MATPQVLLLVGLTLVAAVTDLRHARIPNVLTLPVTAAGVLTAGAVAGWEGALWALIGVGVCGAVPFVLFWRGAMGGGDLKLLAAIGALAGPGVGLEVQLAGYVAAASAVCFRSLLKGELPTLVARSLRFAGESGSLPERVARGAVSVRLGPAVLAGAMFVLSAGATW